MLTSVALLTLTIMSGGFAVMCIAALVRHYLPLGLNYYRYKESAKEVVSEIKIIIDRMCLEEGIPSIRCEIEPFGLACDDDYTACFSRTGRKVLIPPCKQYILPEPERHRYIVEVAAHEICHYIQCSEHSAMARGEREEEAKEVGKLYSLYNWRRLERTGR